MATSTLSIALDRHDIQGLLASGYGHLTEACFVLLHVERPGPVGAWLGRLAEEITTSEGRPVGPAVNVALSPTCLTKLGLPQRVLSRFSDRFLDGMTAEHRRRVLGDVDARGPDHWDWGSPRTVGIDVVLLLYAESGDSLGALEERWIGRAPRDGLQVVRRLSTDLHDREPFGFRDGIAQPVVGGLRLGDDTVSPGEFVLGYPNGYGQMTDRPLLEVADDPDRILPPDAAGSGHHDLGRNGSYLVFRQLSQDVSGFWRFLDEVTRGSDGRSDPTARLKLAAQMVGRWPEGAPLVLAPDAPDDRLHDTDDFGYHHLDPHGQRCPIGAHIRRSRPRDSLPPQPGSPVSVDVADRHRILRRGRVYGLPVAPESAIAEDDGGERGLHFICLCANIGRQFEFVQQSWLNSPKFDGLYADPDPLMGPPGHTFTVQAEPVRRRVHDLPSFVGVRGGGYFFLPGIRALRYLASLSRS